MKAVNKALLTIVVLTFTLTLSAQYAGASLEYVKVKPGQWQNYLELEKSVVEFHKARVEKGIITRWALYQKMYGGSNDAYDFILVTLNDDFKKTQNAFPQELIDELYTKDEQSDFMEKVWTSRDIVKSEYYDRVTFSEYGDWKKDIPMEEILKDVFPDKDMNEARETVVGSRTQVSSEYWELVMSTDKTSE